VVRPGRGRKGYVLLSVLVVLVLAAAALTSLARVSLDLGLEAAARQEDLQQRWGLFTCRRVLLPSASIAFKLRDELAARRAAVPGPRHLLRDVVLLGGQQFALLLSDEDAKLDVNVVSAAAGLLEAEQQLRRLLGPVVAQTVRLRAEGPVLPERPPVQELSSAPRPFGSWGQVFDLSRLRAVAGDDRALAAVTTEITCWGSGRLHLARASDAAVLSLGRSVVTDGLARRVLERARDNPELEAELVVQQEVKNADDAQLLSALLGDGSSSYALWMEASSQRARRQHLAVLHVDAEGRVRTVEFEL
jgi:hypothetical protein